MGAFRNDDEMRQQRIENLEHELAQARRDLEQKNEEILELQNKENTRVNFYLGYNESQVAELESENRELRQGLRRYQPPDLSMALRHVGEANDLRVRLQAMQREVRRTRLLIMLVIVAYWFSTSGGLPL